MPVPTPLHPRTAPLCASWAWKEWAGQLSVRHYGDCHLPEYFAVRQAAGLLDVSPLCKYRVEGPDAAAFLAFVVTRDASRLEPGRVGYTAWCDADGWMREDGTLLRLEEDRFRVTANGPSLAWLRRHARGFRVAIEDESGTVAALAVQGPESRAILGACAGAEAAGLRWFRLARATVAGVTVEVSRTGYTGDLGYEIWCPAESAVEVWDAVLEAGRPHGLQPVGLDALDMLRLEAGYILAGVDYRNTESCLVDEQRTTPFELGLDWTVHLDRAGRFLGRDALRAAAAAGPRRRLVGLEVDQEATETLFEEHGLPAAMPAEAWRELRPVYGDGRRVGRATSGAWSPTLKKNIALALVPAARALPGSVLEVEMSIEAVRHRVPARVVARPFLDLPRQRAR